MSNPATPCFVTAEVARQILTRRVLERQIETLGELAELAMRMARTTTDQATESQATQAAEGQVPDADAPTPDARQTDHLALAFHRAARAVRLTFMLQSKLLEDLRLLNRRAQPSEYDDIDPVDEHKARVQRIVRRLAQDAHDGNPAQVDKLTIEASERLEDEDLYRDVIDRPVGELVAGLCRDLGLEPNWRGLADEPWALDEQDDPRSPFAEMEPPPQATARDVERAEKQVLARALSDLAAYDAASAAETRSASP